MLILFLTGSVKDRRLQIVIEDLHMRKKIDVMLCICFLIGMVLGCGQESNFIEDSDTSAYEVNSEPEMADAAEDELIPDDNAEGGMEIFGENDNSVALYVAKRKLWEPKDGGACSYAWSDIDGNGQPELFIAKQPDGGNGYEIHVFMIEEGSWMLDVSTLTGSGFRTDSLPFYDIWRGHSDGVLYYLDDSTYSYYSVSNMVRFNKFCREEDSVFYDMYGNEITYARWRDLNIAFEQGKILSAEKPVWKELPLQSGHLTDEELLKELKTSYDQYLLSMENREMEEIIDSLRLSHAQNEEEEDLLCEFTKKVQKGESAQIIFLRYTAEDIPVPVYLSYNGEDFYGIWDESEDPYAESVCPYQGFRYEYLKVFSETGEDGMIHETAVLTNEEDLTWEDLAESGDKAGEYPDYLLLYGDIQTKDALHLATDMVRIKKGNFVKRNDVYLIEDGTQLELLSEMVAKGEEMEPGIEAAMGIYRLNSDVKVEDFFELGSKNARFRGGLYGDGHAVAGNFFNVYSSWEEWSYIDYELVEEKRAHIIIEDAETLKEAEQTLASCPTENLVIYVAVEESDMQAAAELIKQCWEGNHERHHYSVSIADVTEHTEKSDALLAFLDLFGEEGRALMEQAAKEEDSYISFIRLERVDGLDICTFAVRASEEEQYHLMLAGEWEDTKVSLKHLLIPATDTSKFETLFGFYRNYNISQADVNFDGKRDLLILEGYFGGSGGSYEEYRAVVWEKDKKEFVWYPSFPEMLVILKFNEQRVIDRYRIGVGYQAICEYGVVDGEYVKTRELIWEDHIDAQTLSYYEMGVLAAQHDVTGMDLDEVGALYPDLDFWG